MRVGKTAKLWIFYEQRGKTGFLRVEKLFEAVDFINRPNMKAI